jgi:hypothetical protein
VSNAAEGQRYNAAEGQRYDVWKNRFSAFADMRYKRRTNF